MIGELASLGAAACWAVGLSLFRRDVREIGAPQVNLFKAIVGTTLYLVVLAVVGFPTLAGRDQLMLVLSGIVGLALGDTLLFAALARLGPHRTALFASLGPVMTAVGGWLLDEPLTLMQMAGISAAAAGVAMVVYFQPHGTAPRSNARGLVLAILAAACQATGVLLAKQGVDIGADPLALGGTALRLAGATAVLALVALCRGRLGADLKRLCRKGPVARLIPAALIGTFLGLGLMQLGIALTKSAVANALHSTTPLFTLPIALFVLRERFRLLAILGSLLGVAGVVVLLLTPKM